jgi:type IV secretory pathway ATPase VirB11/archaellum biosynthesis ATPase
MQNKLFFENYQNEILEVFKKHFMESISKNMNINFDHIEFLTKEHLGISDRHFGDHPYLKVWFEKVYDQKCMSNHISQQSFNELQIHAYNLGQLVYGENKTYFQLDYHSNEDYQLSLEILAQKNNIEWNYRTPFASFNINWCHKKLRATLIHFSTTTNGVSKLFLRHLTEDISTLDHLGLNQDVLGILINAVVEKKNILVCGPTGSGKTTLLKVLLNSTQADEHIITLEDTHELNLKSANHTSLLSNQNHGKTLKDYCSYALRMSPDRLVIGEMRSDEVVPFILAMNTGHRGLMSSIHANSCEDAIARVALLFCIYNQGQEISYETITKLICKSLDMVVFIESKKIHRICKIIGSEADHPIVERLY